MNEHRNERDRFLRSRGGVALIYVAIVTVAICAVGSLAMDYGRAQVVKTELRRAADAAAMAALQEIQSGNGITAAQNSAIAVAAANLADGSPVVVDATLDIEFGTYDNQTDTFTTVTGTSRSTATAMHITCRRTAARGNAVNLVLGPVIGKNSVDVSADSVVALNTPDKFGFVGLDWVSSNDVDMDSYDSSQGAYGGANHYGNASIASNGNLTFAAGCKIRSEAHPGVGGSITKDGATHLGTDAPGNSGNYPILSPVTANLGGSLYYPLVTAPTTNDNANIASKLDSNNNFSISADYNMPAGTYVVNNFTCNTHKITGMGAITIYASGNVTFNKDVTAYLTDTHNFIVYGTASGATINQSQAGGAFYGSIYAPLADVLLNSDNFYGQAIGKTLTMTGKKVHYDESFMNGTVGGPAKKKWIKHVKHWH
jgi:Flp pilus assembly protein TadG